MIALNKKSIKCFFLLFIGMIIFKTNVYADDVGVTISAGRKKVSVGDTVAINVKTKGIMGNFNIKSSNNAVLQGGTTDGFSNPNAQVTTTFIAKANGTATITVNPIDMIIVETEEAYVNTPSVTITVGNKTTSSSTKKDLSSDNTLSSLSIDGVNLEPAFNKNTTSYNVNLEAGVTKINVKATPNDKSAKVTGIGEIEVSEGNNNIEVVVTAENGSTKTYTITANVKEYDPINVKVENSKYTVVRNIKNVTAPNVYEETKIKINGQ